MIKIISNWLFASHIWADANPTPIAINLHEISHIDQIYVPNLGGNVVAIYTNSDSEPITIEGDIIEILAKLQEYLTNNY